MTQNDDLIKSQGGILRMLDADGNLIVATDPKVWKEWFCNHENRKVAQHMVGSFDVRTTFVGGSTPFQTMVFDDANHGSVVPQFTCGALTKKDAAAQHTRTLLTLDKWGK